jgi:hypothetical protein
MVFNATFNNISVISWENHQPVASYWQTLSHNVVSSTPRLSVIRTISLKEKYTCIYVINLITGRLMLSRSTKPPGDSNEHVDVLVSAN